MANLAIKGHTNRYKEVIEILEMLGGKNLNNLDGASNMYYFIGLIVPKILSAVKSCLDTSYEQFTYFTLEEFEEKFPYKIGNKVYYNNKVCDVIEMFWNSNLNTISYGVYDGKIKNLAIVEELKLYKEETMRKNGTLVEIDFTKELCVADEVEVILGDYEFVLKDGRTYFIKKKPQYPETYKECCEVLGMTYDYPDIKMVSIDECSLYSSFIELIRCRNAYWKIAGEELGLGKPWEPNWTTFKGMPAIFRFRYNIVCDSIKNQHCLLVFPTEEMRDAFCENFKDLIEECKELL